jgi:hypothetical protein
MCLSLGSGCTSSAPSAVEPPEVEPQAAATKAIETYDRDKDGALSADETKGAPAIARFLSAYDQDGNKQVTEAELAARFEKVFASGGALTVFSCTVLYNGQPLDGAEVSFEPEPFLGEGFKTGRGTTSYGGVTKIAIADSDLPEVNRGLGAIYNGLYKVTVTHPTTRLPGAYQGENTVLGYEVSGISSAGTQATFALDSKGTAPK